MNTICIVCNNQTSIFCRQAGYSFARCSSCKFFFVEPMPTDTELTQIYSPSAGYQSNKTKKDYTKVINHKYVKIFNELKNYTTPNTLVLDVGASDGEFLYYAKKSGFQPFGVEPNKTTADIANRNNLNVFHGFLGDSGFNKNSFGLLRLGDVLEHSNNPHTLIQECKNFLTAGGLILISIPNMDSIWVKVTYGISRVFALPWSVLEPPHHLLYFSKDNLDLFMKNKGFSFVTTWYDRPPTLKYELGSTHLFGQFKKNKNIKNVWMFLFGFACYSIAYVLDFLITPFKTKDYSMVCIYKKNA